MATKKAESSQQKSEKISVANNSAVCVICGVKLAVVYYHKRLPCPQCGNRQFVKRTK